MEHGNGMQWIDVLTVCSEQKRAWLSSCQGQTYLSTLQKNKIIKAMQQMQGTDVGSMRNQLASQRTN